MTTALVRPEATATITVATPIVIQPGLEYSYGWETDDPSWEVYGPEIWYTERATWAQLDGAYGLYIEGGHSSVGGVRRTFTGLTPGRTYTVSFRIYTDLPENIVTVLGTAQTYYTGAGAMTITRTFTAVSASQVIDIALSSSAGVDWIANIDTFSLVSEPVTTLTPILPISEGKVTMADDWSPYVQAVFEVPVTDAALTEQIDPKLGQRVTVQVQEAIGGTSRTLNLGLRARSIDHAAKTIRMELASDEALLMDRKNVSATVDKTPRTYETSLRAICNWALGKIGATLQPGTDDADLTARWTAQNLVPNPGVRNVLGNYIAGGVNASLVRSTGHPAPPVAGLTTYTTTNWSGNSGSGQGGAYNQSGNVAPKLQVSAGKTYNVSLYVSSTPKPMRLMVQVFASDGTVIDGGRQVATITTTTSWQRVSGTITIPAGGAYLGIYIYPQVGQQFVSGNALVTTGWQVTEGAELLPYFDGSTTAGSGYTYAYAGDANTSASERTPTGPERLPALFDWKPGQSLWDFLSPLMDASGLRLFCDEQRRWYLVNPETYDVPGFVAVQEKHNATRGTDEVTRNDDTWADAVVAVYEWDDADGNSQTAYDFAGDPNGKCVTLTYQREFPGPGAAAYALARLQGKGRTQEVTALTNYGTTPGQDVQITLPGTLAQTGKVREVIFDLKTGLMDLGTRGLTDAYPGSWALWNPTQTWSAVNATLKWKDA